MNRKKKIVIVTILLTSLFLYSQNQGDEEEGEVIKLEAQKIKIEPVKPNIILKRKEIAPSNYSFFRSFEDEVKAVPKDMFEIDFDSNENKVDDLNELLSKPRK